MNETVRKLRHDLRGAANMLMLCTASLRYGNREEQLEFLGEIEKATDKFIDLLDSLEALPEHFAAEADDSQ
jgi:hypothetical protein